MASDILFFFGFLLFFFYNFFFLNKWRGWTLITVLLNMSYERDKAPMIVRKSQWSFNESMFIGLIVIDSHELIQWSKIARVHKRGLLLLLYYTARPAFPNFKYLHRDGSSWAIISWGGIDIIAKQPINKVHYLEVFFFYFLHFILVTRVSWSFLYSFCVFPLKPNSFSPPQVEATFVGNISM